MTQLQRRVLGLWGKGSHIKEVQIEASDNAPSSTNPIQEPKKPLSQPQGREMAKISVTFKNTKDSGMVDSITSQLNLPICPEETKWILENDSFLQT